MNESVRSFRWRVDEIAEVVPGAPVITHRSEAFSCSLSGNQDFSFHLVMKIREDGYEVDIESRNEDDVELLLGIGIESNGYRFAHKPFHVVAPGAGKNASSPQHEGILWGSMRQLLQSGLGGVLFSTNSFSAPVAPRIQIANGGANVSRPAAIITVNIFVEKKYRKPCFGDRRDAVAASSVGVEGSLADDLAKAFDNETDANLTVICQSSPEFPAAQFRVQRGILAMRSDVFAAMFSHGFSESSTCELRIADMTPEVTKEFLYYLYTDQVNTLKDHAEGLLVAANKYNLPRLKSLCEEAICQDLDDAKVIDVAVLAHQNLAENAKRFAIEEIVQNFPDVIKQESWAKLVVEFPELLQEIHKCLATRVSQLNRSSTRFTRE